MRWGEMKLLVEKALGKEVVESEHSDMLGSQYTYALKSSQSLEKYTVLVPSDELTIEQREMFVIHQINL